MPTGKISYTITGVGDNSTASKEVTDTALQAVEESISDGVSDQLIDNVSIDQSTVSLLWIIARGGDLTVKTNSSGTPDDTFNLVDGVPLTYAGNAGETNPLSADVTSLYVSNSSGASVTLEVKAMQDATP